MKCPSPINIKDPSSQSTADRLVVPCGKCGACHHNRRTEWSFRLKQELRYSKTAYFLTFTYDDQNVPISETGIPTLDKRHWQLFAKKLRQNIQKFGDYRFRYYTVGEYGEKTERPHYHTCAYNIPPELIPKLPDIWEHGNIHTGILEDASIHYITKYHVNRGRKQHEFVDDSTGELFIRNPEFATMSRRPGIGNGYVQSNAEWHRSQEHNFVINNGYKQRIPRYYREKIFDPITRKAINQRSIPKLDKDYNNEIKRLSNLKIEKPNSYIIKSQVIKASKVRDKINERDTF